MSSVVADHFGWRAMFVIAAVLMAAISIVLALTVPKRQPDHSASYGQLLGSLWTLLRQQPVLRQRAFYQGCMFATFSLFWTAVPLELARNHGLSQTQIAIFAWSEPSARLPHPSLVDWPMPATPASPRCWRCCSPA